MLGEPEVPEMPGPEQVPTVTGTGNPRTPSTPGRRPGQRNGTGITTKKTPAARPAPPVGSKPPAPKARGSVDRRPAVEKVIRKVGSSLLITAKTRKDAALAADAITLLEQKDAWAECLNEMAKDTGWLAKVIDKAAVIAPGAEAASLLIALTVQVGVNHAMIPLEMGKLMDAKDPRDLLALHGIATVVEPAAEPAA